jgi:UDP-N-acetylmuramoyl-L-alanyl-D-glutamate--2,6-diaminopimelate ligase
MNNLNQISLPTIWPVACHTDHVGPGSTFVVIKGHSSHGLKFVAQALQKGAKQIVVEEDMVGLELLNLVNSFKANLLTVANTRQALSNLSAQAWGDPAQKLKIIGVTGTKGKTTTVYALRHILANSGKKVAMLTGVENMISDQKFVANLTTPHPDYLHMFLAQCVQAGIEYVVMEVSAQALSLNRVDDLQFISVIFTNLELEHSEFYASIEHYFLAKCQIFNLVIKSGLIILNSDDAWVQKILANQQLFFSKEFAGQIITFGCQQNAGLALDSILEITQPSLLSGLEFNLVGGPKKRFNYQISQLYGVFNAYNLSGAILCTQNLGLTYHQVQQAVQSFVSAPGRLEIYRLPNGARGVVDYAHTPSSFENILTLLRQETSQLIIIFGAGGGRDPIKRPVMGEIATKFGDVVILTNDNPRNEDPQDIVQQIMGKQDFKKFLIEFDRAQAVKLAYQLSKPGAIIVLLGKGPDEYQIIANQKQFFSDRDQFKQL